MISFKKNSIVPDTYSEIYDNSPQFRDQNTPKRDSKAFDQMLRQIEPLKLFSKVDSIRSDQTPGNSPGSQDNRAIQRKFNQINLKNSVFSRQATKRISNSEKDFSNISLRRDYILDTSKNDAQKSILNDHHINHGEHKRPGESKFKLNKTKQIFMDSQNNENYQIMSPLQSVSCQSEVQQQNPVINKVSQTFESTLKVVYLVRRFLTKISEKRRRKFFFSARHFEIFGDKASEMTPSLANLYEPKKNTISSVFLRKIRIYHFLRQKLSCAPIIISSTIKRIFNKIPLIQPESKSKILWDMVSALVMIYFFILIPIQIFFDNEILFQENTIISIMFIFFLMIDYFVKMNTIYYEFGKAVNDRAMIFNQYLKTNLIIDGLSISVLMISFINSQSLQYRTLNISLILFFTQYHYISKVLSNLEESLNLSKLEQSFLNLIKLISTLLIFEHFFSCIWFFIAQYKQNQNQINWMVVRDIVNESWQVKYIESFYFTTVAMTTVGFGDIVPQNSLEQVVCIIFMLGACVQMSFVVSTVGDIINGWTQQDKQVTKKIRIINNYMQSKNVGFALQYQRIRQYLKIYWQQEVQEVHLQEEQIINNLSEDLKKQLMFESNNSFIQQSLILKNNFSKITNNNLLNHIRTLVITPEHMITSQLPHFNEPALCRIEQGQLLFYGSAVKDTPLQILKQSDYFGSNEFITGQTPQTLYFTQGFLKLNFLTRSDFLKVLKESPQDYEEFCILKDRQLFESQNFEARCVTCRSHGHSIENCPLLHFNADREKVVKSYQFDQIQPRGHRRSKEKRGRSQYCALSDWWAIKEIAMLHQTNELNLRTFYNMQNQAYNRQNDGNIFHRHVEQQFQLSSPLKLHFFGTKSDRQSAYIKHPLIHQNSQPLSVRQKFQQIVNKVIHLNKSRLFINSQYENLKLIIDEKERIQAFNNNIYIDLISLDQNESIRLLSGSEYEQLQIITLKIKLLPFFEEINKTLQKQQNQDEYDCQKEFQFYQPHNNLSSILIQSEEEEETKFKPPSHQIIQLYRRTLAQKLLSYMYYPHIYFKKFVRESKKQQKRILNHKSSILDANIILEKFKQTKVRQKVRKNTLLYNEVLRLSQKSIVSTMNTQKIN